MIIDPPSPFAPVEEWRDFYFEMLRYQARTPEERAEVAAAVKDAEAALLRLDQSGGLPYSVVKGKPND